MRRIGSTTGCVIAIVTFATALATEVALGQYSGGNGRLLDANPSVYGGRFNSAARQGPPSLVGGNAFASGLAGRGLSLRSFSPIPAASAFRGSLGSSSLSGFRRNSISVADVGSPLGGLLPRTYIDPAASVASVGDLRTGYVPVPSPSVSGFSTAPGRDPFQTSRGGFVGSTSALASPYGDTRVPGTEFAEPRNTLLPTGLADDRGRLPRVVTGELFGPRRLTEPLVDGFAPRITRQAEVNRPFIDRLRDRYGFERDAAAGQADAIDDTLRGPVDMRVWEQPRDLSFGSPLDLAEDRAARRLTLEQALGVRAVDAPTGRSRDARAAAPEVRVDDVSMLPGHDVFTDMQLALTLREHPDQAWFDQMRETVADSPAASETMIERSAASAEEFRESVLESEIQTLATGHESELNAVLRAAEGAMDLGNYYEAAEQFEVAQAIAPSNPLPLLGQGHALLAAGEYRSAAERLATALSRFPDLLEFRYDLNALLGGGEIVDIRRAELSRQLALSEDYELRFLLGWLELHSGNRPFARENLTRAANDAPRGNFIGRVPALLRALDRWEDPTGLEPSEEGGE